VILADDIPGINPLLSYCDNQSRIAGEFVAVGKFKEALATLKK